MIRYSIIILSIALATPLLGDSVDDAIKRVQQQIIEEKAKLAKQRTDVAKKRKELRRLIAEQDAKDAKVSLNYRSLEKTLTGLEETFYAQENLHARTSAQIKRCRQLLIEARKDLQTPVQSASPATSAFDALDKSLSDSAIAPAAIADGLSGILKSHLLPSPVLERSDATVLKPDGEKIKAPVYTVKGISCYMVEGERVGILEPNATEKCYTLHPTLLPGAMSKSVINSLSAKDGIIHLPIDVTGGRGLSRLETKKDLIGFLKAGGPVVIPLLIIAVIAVIMVIERFFYLLRVDKNVESMLARVVPYLETADYDGALATVGNSRGPVSNIIQAAVSHGRQKTDKLEELLQEAILSELPSLERFLGALAVMAAAAPLLGLLGTVSGMIGTFEVISTYGTGNAKLLSGGISEALITTEVGLIVAVPILLAHAWLNRQVRTLVGHMDRAAISLASAIRQKKEEG